MAADTIDGYFENLIEREQIYQDDVTSCCYHMDLDFLRERIFTNNDKIVNSFRCKVDEDYMCLKKIHGLFIAGGSLIRMPVLWKMA